MKKDQSINGQVVQEPKFPIRWLTLIMVFELAMIAVSVWLIGYTEVRVREGMKRQVRLERLHGDITHLDEVLTMSARMAAASGDQKWERRYLSFEPKLENKIRDVMAEAKVLELDLAELGISTTNEANSRLVSMEKQAFEHVRNNEPAKARLLLSSDSYNENKKLYAEGLEKLLDRLDSLVTSLVASQKTRVQASQLISIVGWVLLIAIWIVVLRGLGTWRTTLLNTQAELATHQTQLQERVFSMAKQLTRVEHQERQRIAGLLHDQLQQLLVACRLQLSLLPEGSAREQVNQLLEQSIQLSRSLTNELNPPGLMLASFGDAVKWLADWSKDNHGLQITLDITENLPNVDTETKVIAFDAIREVLFNISKHSGIQTADMSVGCSDAGSIQIEIVDQGVGFDPDLIWSGERFGLLNTSRRLELIGGFLEMTSKLGNGATACITLPRQSLADSVDHVAPEIPGVREKLKVLIVDDHPVVRAGLVSALGRIPDMEFREASGMSDVEATIGAFEPDVAIVDISLGEGAPDGCEITRFLCSKIDPIKVVAFTSFDDSVNRERMATAGASHYLVKGCHTKDLIDAIRT